MKTQYKRTEFVIRNGAVNAGCPQETKTFLKENCDFFNGYAIEMQELLGEKETITIVAAEADWTTGMRGERTTGTELIDAHGVLVEGSVASADRVFSDLNPGESHRLIA